MINPDDAREWQVLSDTEQARLRFSVMRELSWFDWDHRPAWWWAKEHATLLELKWACGWWLNEGLQPIEETYA